MRKHDQGDEFVRMFYVAMEWDCSLCGSVFRIKTRASFEAIDEWLLSKGWKVDEHRWTCPDCVATPRVPRSDARSFWYRCPDLRR